MVNEPLGGDDVREVILPADPREGSVDERGREREPFVSLLGEFEHELVQFIPAKDTVRLMLAYPR